MAPGRGRTRRRSHSQRDLPDDKQTLPENAPKHSWPAKKKNTSNQHQHPSNPSTSSSDKSNPSLRHKKTKLAREDESKQKSSRRQRPPRNHIRNNTYKNNTTNNNNTTESIEAQLTRQRLQQQEQQKQQSESNTDHDTLVETRSTTPAQSMGLYHYDPERNAYFLPDPHHEESRTSDRHNHVSSRALSPPVPASRSRTFPHLTFATDGSVWEMNKKIHDHHEEEKDDDQHSEHKIVPSLPEEDQSPKYQPTGTLRARPRSCSTTTWDWMFHRQSTLATLPRTRLLTTWGVAADFWRRLRLIDGTHWAHFYRQDFSPHDSRYSLLSDLTCKIHKPPWIQTFDVWDAARSTTTGTARDDQTDTKNLQLQIATVVEKGYEIRSLVQQDSTQGGSSTTTPTTPPLTPNKRCFRPPTSYRPQSARYFDMPLNNISFEPSESSRPTRVLALLSSNERETTFTIEFSPRRLNTWELDVEFPIPSNDVIDAGGEYGMFYLAASRGSPWRVSFDRRQVSHPLKVRNLSPTSEILCLERLSSSEASGKQSLLLSGHRNGQVTLFDPQNEQVCSQLGGSDYHINSGSITGISSLGRNCERSTGDKSGISHEHLVLTRQQNLAGSPSGIAALWDIRRAHQPVFEFHIPESIEPHSRFTKRCSGMATDPLGTTLLAPFVQDHDLGEIPCLGFWSLISGEFVGHRSLAQPSEHIPVSSKTSVSWVELNSKRTRPLEWDENGSHMRSIPGRSFGLWYKCGQAPNAHTRPGELLSSSAGNIHHIVI